MRHPATPSPRAPAGVAAGCCGMWTPSCSTSRCGAPHAPTPPCARQTVPRCPCTPHQLTPPLAPMRRHRPGMHTRRRKHASPMRPAMACARPPRRPPATPPSNPSSTPPPPHRPPRPVQVVSPRNHFVMTPLLASTSVGTLDQRSVAVRPGARMGGRGGARGRGTGLKHPSHSLHGAQYFLFRALCVASPSGSKFNFLPNFSPRMPLGPVITAFGGAPHCVACVFGAHSVSMRNEWAEGHAGR